MCIEGTMWSTSIHNGRQTFQPVPLQLECSIKPKSFRKQMIPCHGTFSPITLHESGTSAWFPEWIRRMVNVRQSTAKT